jgi:hypothetical protein
MPTSKFVISVLDLGRFLRESESLPNVSNYGDRTNITLKIRIVSGSDYSPRYLVSFLG